MTLTGDPFVDSGLRVMQWLRENISSLKNAPDIDLIRYVADLYVKKWESKLHAFFLNAPIVHPSVKTADKVTKTVEYYSTLLNGSDSRLQDGYCRISGKQGKVLPTGRDNSFLVGSGAFINFHHHHDSGLFYSPEVIVANFFVPLAVVQVGSKPAIVYSSYEPVSMALIESAMRRHNLHGGANISSGILKSDYSLTVNALFDFADQSLQVKKIWEDDAPTNLVMLHFTNFAQSPEIEIYEMPDKIFSFYKTCNGKELRPYWLPFLHSHYRNKNAEYDLSKDTFTIHAAKATEEVESKQFKKWRNTIYENLLWNKSLSREFVKWYEKGNKFNFLIISEYYQRIRYMSPKTIEKVKQIAAFAAGDNDRLKKTILQLRKAQRPYDFRRIIIDQVRANHAVGNKDALLTVEEYVEAIIPDSAAWYEIRDILLIALYEEVHKQDIMPEEFDNDEIEEEIELT